MHHQVKMTSTDLSLDATLNSGNSYLYTSAWRDLSNYDTLSLIVSFASASMVCSVEFANSATPAQYTTLNLDISANITLNQSIKPLGTFYRIKLQSLVTATATLLTRKDSGSGPANISVTSMPNSVTNANTILTLNNLGSTPTAISTSRVRVKALHAYNSSQAPAYIHFFNATTANITLGVTTPISVFCVPPNSALNFPDVNVGCTTALSAVALTGSSSSASAAPVPGLLLTTILSADAF